MQMLPIFTRTTLGSLLGIGIAWILLACGPSGEVTAPEAGSLAPASSIRSVTRVVTLSPAASDFVLSLDARRTLIGIDADSARISDLAHLPVVDLASALELEPDLVLVPELSEREAGRAEEARVRGVDVVEFAPHDFEDAFELCRQVGARLVGPARARAFENSIARELARIAGASFGQPRPRVAAVTSFDPFEIAGGHSFTTDLIEIAGGNSVTHGGGEVRVGAAAAGLAAYAPDLVLVVSPLELDEYERRGWREVLPGETPVLFLAFDGERYWMRGAVAAAGRLRESFRAVSAEPSHIPRAEQDPGSDGDEANAGDPLEGARAH